MPGTGDTQAINILQSSRGPESRGWTENDSTGKQTGKQVGCVEERLAEAQETTSVHLVVLDKMICKLRSEKYVAVEECPGEVAECARI